MALVTGASMDVVMGAMGRLPGKLLELLKDEYKLQSGVRSQVEFLSRELEFMHVALCKVAQAAQHDQLDQQVKLWSRDVREASYDIEDVVDTFLVCVDSGPQPPHPNMAKRRRIDVFPQHANQNWLQKVLTKIGNFIRDVKTHHDITNAIEGIKKRLEEMAERRARYRVDELVANASTTTSTIDPRLAAMYKEVTQLIGVDKSRGEIMSMLALSSEDHVSNNNKILKMVSIVGVGGLGKTTLAKASYDKLKPEYDCGAFISVGRNPDLAKVFKDILFDLDKPKYGNIHNTGRGIDLIIRELREFLENKRYFIVFDDIWETQSWEIMKLALVENYCGSRIITTTRKLEVAKEAGGIYKLQPLSVDNSKKLLHTRIFDGKGLDNQLDEIANKILKKCDGIPLAIITMASLFVGKPRELWPELYNAIGFGNKDNRNVENTMKILSFSYYDLPSHLKTCLLYLCAFPEDYVIQKDSLIWKWIAEGFIHEKQPGKNLFELGEGYFNDLINRSMIQAVESEYDYTVQGCRVHDMVLDLIRSLSHEEEFVSILDNVEGTSPQSTVRWLAHQNKTRDHVSLQTYYKDMPQVRSYITCRCDISQWVPFSKFKLLRVLAIENCQTRKYWHLENLMNLIHLRYLGLRGTSMRELPKQMGDLKFLQALDVAKTGIRELPASVVQLTQLSCLHADSWSTRAPEGMEKLTSLEELRIYAGRDDKSKRQFVKKLGSLRELRVLETTTDFIDEGMERNFVESLRNLYKIQYLSLQPTFHVINADVATWEAAGFVLPQHLRHLRLQNIRFSRLPSCISLLRLHNLSYLGLRVATLDELDLRLLGRLPELLFLSLKTRSAVTISNINATDGYFQKLRFLEMPDSMVQLQRNMEDLTMSFHTWNGILDVPFGSREYDNCRPSAVMPNLQVLRIRVFVRASKDGNVDCGNIIGLEYLTSLQNVILWINCEGASTADVEEAETALRNATDVHPNRPTLDMPRWNEDKMIWYVQNQELEDDNIPTEKEYEEEEEWEGRRSGRRKRMVMSN